MKGNFFQLKKFLESHFPELQGVGKVEGHIQPPTLMGELVGNVISMVWLSGVALLMGGGYIFGTLLQMPEPEWYVKMKAHQMQVFVGLFLLNNFGAAMMQTGAFEVCLNGVKVYSKLETGRMPTGHDIVEAFGKHGL